ncbi:MAG: integrase/recombinase XerD [Clostridia bacterium]|nr:integrase/recombinase XerD [Clostridia bacterium]
MLLFCGLRVGELVGLRVEDLEIKERSGKLTVRGKGAKYREVPVPSNVRRALREYLGERKSGPLFLGQRGPLTPRGVQQLLKKYAYQAKIEKLSPHVLRHTCATNLLNSRR